MAPFHSRGRPLFLDRLIVHPNQGLDHNGWLGSSVGGIYPYEGSVIVLGLVVPHPAMTCCRRSIFLHRATGVFTPPHGIGHCAVFIAVLLNDDCVAGARFSPYRASVVFILYAGISHCAVFIAARLAMTVLPAFDSSHPVTQE